MLVTATEQNRAAQLNQVVDGVTSPSYKWFSLQENRLDGTYHPMSNSEPVGWWGTTLSDADGYLDPTPQITVDFQERRSMHKLQVVGDALLDEYPVDFVLELYDGGTLVYTETVFGNTQAAWTKQLPQVYDITKYVLTVFRINKPGRTVKILEANNHPHLVRNETVNVALTESTAMLASLISSSDTLDLDVPDSSFFRHYEFKRQDTVQFSASDGANLTNIHTVMDAPFRKIYGKVEITYTDPFVDADVTVTASTTAYGTNALQTADMRSAPSYKWFSLQDNKLDGSYHPMPAPGDEHYSVGWWGTVVSDTGGVLNPIETLRVDFTSRAQFELKVVGDAALGEFPVDFDVILRDSQDQVLHTEVVRNNTQVQWIKQLTSAITGVASIELKVYKINKPNRTVKVVEFFTALKETYTDEDLISIDLLEEQAFDDMTLPFGNVSANEIEVRFNNVDRRFDPDNINSPVYGWLKKNRKIKAWLGAEVVPGEIEWYQLGVFWSQEWNAPESAIYATVTGLDRLELLRQTDFTKSQIYVNKSLYEVAEIILADAGLKPDEYIIDTALRAIVVPYVWFPKTSHRAALVQIAQAALGRVFCDRQGRVVVTTFSTTPYPLYTFDYDKSIIDLDRPFALGQITNYVEVKAKPRQLQPLTEVYRSAEPIVLQPGEVYTETITFNELPVMNIQQPQLVADEGIIVSNFQTYAWGAEITFTHTGTSQGTVTQFTIQGQPLSIVGERVAIVKDDRSIWDNGKQPYTLENDFIQSYQLAQTIAQDILDTYNNPRHDAKIDCRGNIALTLGDRVLIPTKQGQFIDHIITRQSLTWEGSLDAKVDAQILV